MACSAYRWTPELVAAIPAALVEGGSIMAAARILGVGENGLRAAIRNHGIDHRSLCARARPAPAPEPVKVPPKTPSDPRGERGDLAPEWQFYRPRPGWTATEATRPAEPSSTTADRVVCIADVHAPNHSRPAWSTALALVRELEPTRVILLGDFMEVESVSRHGKSRPDLVRLAEEFHATNILLDELQDAAPSASFSYLAGNHEDRIHKWCMEFGSMDGMLNVPEALYMTPRGDYHRATDTLRGMTWIGLERQPFVVVGCAYLHGVYETVNHAMQTASQLGPVVGVRQVIYGHMHAVQQATSASGHTATCAGWLGDATAATIRAYVKGRPRPWSHAIVYQEIDGDLVTTTPIPISGGRALWAGARFDA